MAEAYVEGRWTAASAAPPRSDAFGGNNGGYLDKQPAVYILANRRNGTLYTGVTSDLVKRVWEHKSDFIDGFSRRYAVHMLVYFELFDTMDAAITREKQIKAGSRARKLQLIESMNVEWKDLYDSIV